MENDIYNERKQIHMVVNNKFNNLLENLNQKKSHLLKNCTNININMDNSSNLDSTFSHKKSINSINLKKSDIKLNNDFNIVLEGNSNKANIRKDNYGNEIKKGGKQKIAFADELNLGKSLKKEYYPKNKKKKIFSSKNLEEENLDILIKKRRSYSPIYKRSSIQKFFFNIYKRNYKKNFHDFLVDIIKIESIKKETKRNTFSIKKLNSEEEQQVCCSCYCLII